MSNISSKIFVKFLGAAGTVTGSKYLVSYNRFNLMVDCWLFQGFKNLRELNWMALPFPASEIKAVLITHGHLDHIGYLPRFINQGFEGTIYCTEPTADLAEIILRDSAKIQEEDAAHANKSGYSKHTPALPLYTMEDVDRTLSLIRAIPVNHYNDLTNNIRFRFMPNAHIPGAASIELIIDGTHLVFSGDIGRSNDPILPPPIKPEYADYLFVESTYGDRLHPTDSTEEVLFKIIQNALANHGPLIVPSFTIDRAQDFMYFIWKLKKENRIPDIPVYLDSPMGNDVSRLFLKYPEWIKLRPGVFTEVFESTRMVHSVEETRHLAKNEHPRIIIAGSGMMNGGRILHYLETHLDDPKATVVIPGYQAAGTRGRMISEGAPEVKIHGHYVKVRATIEHIHTMSSHADQAGLLDWMANIKNKPEKVFIVHGEPHSAQVLRVKIRDHFGWNATVPQLLDQVNLITQGNH